MGTNCREVGGARSPARQHHRKEKSLFCGESLRNKEYLGAHRSSELVDVLFRELGSFVTFLL